MLYSNWNSTNRSSGISNSFPFEDGFTRAFQHLMQFPLGGMHMLTNRMPGRNANQMQTKLTYCFSVGYQMLH